MKNYFSLFHSTLLVLDLGYGRAVPSSDKVRKKMPPLFTSQFCYGYWSWNLPL